jgi:hypothetical protein
VWVAHPPSALHWSLSSVPISGYSRSSRYRSTIAPEFRCVWYRDRRIAGSRVVEDFRDLLAELRRAEARFLVVGAHALAAHGVPRATVDLDVWIDPSPENAARVWSALAAFGAPLDALMITPADLTRPDTVAQFGLPPWRIDILTGISGVTFDEAWPDRMEAYFDDVLVPFIGQDAFIRNKRASGRLKDLADIEALGGE